VGGTPPPLLLPTEDELACEVVVVVVLVVEGEGEGEGECEGAPSKMSFCAPSGQPSFML
jgi:hypothetical protein